MERRVRAGKAGRPIRGALSTPILVLGVTGGLGAVPTAAQELHVNREADRLVRSISQAPIEDFDGVTDRIDGYVLLDGPTPAESTGGESTEFYFEVELAGLDTGIGLRNRHMRDNYLEVERYPYATFEGTVEELGPDPDGGLRLTAAGAFSVHGVSRAMRVPCQVASEGDGWRVRCAFQVLLSDHDIEIPQVMFLKLANEIELELDFALRRAP